MKRMRLKRNTRRRRKRNIRNHTAIQKMTTPNFDVFSLKLKMRRKRKRRKSTRNPVIVTVTVGMMTF